MPAKGHIETKFVVLNDVLRADTIAVTDTFWTDLDKKYGDFAGNSLISSFTFTEDWPTWEVHPAGDEFVCLLHGKIEMILAMADGDQQISLTIPGEFVIVPKGIWHTTRVFERTTLLFVTPGQGTENRTRPDRPSVN